jgi:hypothetical protein
MTADITLHRVLCVITEDKNMVFVDARLQLLPEVRISFREKIIGIQEVSQSMM